MPDDRTNLSQKNIDPKDRLIFALDVESSEQAQQLVERLDDAVTFYKLGLEMFMGGNYYETIDWLLARDKKVFVDLKFFEPIAVSALPPYMAMMPFLPPPSKKKKT
jgi:orotidine-5'-phosphate decarboxylase